MCVEGIPLTFDLECQNDVIDYVKMTSFWHNSDVNIA